jgi:energy-coupling factor transport system permease protein
MPARPPANVIQYVRTTSILHRMDPMSKLLAVFGFSLLVAITADPRQLLVLAALIAAGALVLGHVPPGQLVRGARIFLVFGAGVMTFQLLFNHFGQPIAHLGPLTIYSNGLEFGLLKMLNICVIALSSFTFIWTTNPRSLVVTLVHFGVPYRFAWALFLVLRFGPVFEEELHVIKDAQRVRGFRQRAGVTGKIEQYKRYTIPMLVSMVRKATNIAIAMDGRAFGAYADRTFVDDFHWSRSGFVLMALLAATIVVTAVFGSPFVTKQGQFQF